MSLWVDKYRPTSLEKLTIHDAVNKRLESLAESNELPHLLVYGPSGAGKKTRVIALLRQLFGPGVERVKLEHRTFKATANKTVELTMLGSNFHIECNPSDVGNNDRFVIQEVVKEIASHSSLTGASGNKTDGKTYKAVILTEVDKLSRQAQAGLRRTMERYSASCRLILVANSTSKIIEPLRSRCLSVRVPAPTVDVLADLLMQTCNTARVNCPRELAVKVAVHSGRSIRRALLMLEAMKVQSPQLTPGLIVMLPDWELFSCRMAREICQEQSPTKLTHVREMCYELLGHCIPPDVIMTTLVRELLKNLDDSLKHEVVYWAAFYEHRMRQGTKEIFHFEAFIAKFMALYKRFIILAFE
jgi:replication factor C subunit 3/5